PTSRKAVYFGGCFFLFAGKVVYFGGCFFCLLEKRCTFSGMLFVCGFADDVAAKLKKLLLRGIL
ncbi:MAG: hypothetical protein IKD29_10525, partial [Lentisphaeria bacterium]|nr:hypothetical protein [Lentisphaeria bacterium]